jgi:hypothetical protein
MVRVKQFADDLAISTKKAKDLINKGRNRKDGGSQILESVMKKPMYAKNGKKVVLPKPRPKNLKKKKTSEQIVREINEYDITKSDITESLDKEFSRKVAKQNEEAMKNVKKKKDGGLQDIPSNNKGLPNLPTAVRNKMGYKKAGGVLKMSRGGGIAIQGLGFKGVR